MFRVHGFTPVGYCLLFKQLFNWLKYKTLPSSVLFKNRLFIERDSKHRRIMSSWGLTFRNSKWTNYSLSNVSTHSITSFFKFLKNLTIIIFFGLAVQSHFNFYDMELSFNSFSYFLWAVKAQTSHIMFASFWCVYQITNNLFNVLFYRYLTTLFQGPLTTNLKQDLTNFELNSTNSNLTDNRVSVIMKNTILHAGNDKSLNSLTDLFDNKSSNTADILILLKRLYSLTNLITLYRNDGVDFSIFTHQNTVTPLKKKNLYLGDLHMLQPQDRWSLTQNPTKGIVSREGLFYTTNFDYRLLNNNNDDVVNVFNFDLKNQNNVVGIQRFMYRYNPLHRSVMKGSINLTHTKKLLALYKDSPLLSLTNSNILNSKQPRIFNNFDRDLTIKVAKAIEDSYFFTLKRYYLFNNLSSNKISASFDIKSNSFDLTTSSNRLDNISMFYNSLLSVMLKKDLVSRYNIISLDSVISCNNTLPLNPTKSFNNFDIIINLNDNNLFTNNDFILHYVDQLHSMKTQLNLFDLVNTKNNLDVLFDFTPTLDFNPTALKNRSRDYIFNF